MASLTNYEADDVVTNVPEKLWEPQDVEHTNMTRFMQSVNDKYNLRLKSYDGLYDWSVEHLEEFWAQVWDYTGMVGQRFSKVSRPWWQRRKTTVELKSAQVVDQYAPMFPRPDFFQGSQVNFAQNLLHPSAQVDADAPALLGASECSRSLVTWRQLREQVKQLQAAMLASGVQAGDRVAGYVANHPQTVIAALAATSLGAVWTAVSTDTGVHAVLDRLGQVEPKVLFADNAAAYNGKVHAVVPKLREIVAQLPSLQTLVMIATIYGQAIDSSSVATNSGKTYMLDEYLALGDDKHELQFPLFAPDHPVYILYSSGTTGAPKCIVHGSVGTLIQHKKEHVLHCSLGPQSRILYFTTVSWMMWHWSVSGLASGATVVLYDGSPFRYRSEADPSGSQPDDLAMPRLVKELQVTDFGTSAKYLSVLEQKQVRVGESLQMDGLQAIYSTGSPLAPSTFSYTYEAFGSHIRLGSITGGTDIISLFGAPSPISPVYAGEIQKAGLGMAIRAFDHAGNDITQSGEPGDLVCVKAFPCQPIYFYGASGNRAYQRSYFERFKDGKGQALWHHGDFIRFNPATGGLIMLGRSDGVLKPAGVRFGSAEIYNVLMKWFPNEIEDALCVGRRRESDTDETVVLFVKMADGHSLSEELINNIKAVIRKELSARHVPGIIHETPEIPVTSNGKKVEAAVKLILSGTNMKMAASVANASCLDWYRTWAAMSQR